MADFFLFCSILTVVAFLMNLCTATNKKSRLLHLNNSAPLKSHHSLINSTFDSWYCS